MKTFHKMFKDVQGSSGLSSNPYAVDVIRAKRRDLVSGISRTEDLLDLLVEEGLIQTEKRSVIMRTARTREEQNSRVLDILVSRGERACRIFFHPCLMLTEPDLYQRIKAYVGDVNASVRDGRRQLIGYLSERDQKGLDKSTCDVINPKMAETMTIQSVKKARKIEGKETTVSKEALTVAHRTAPKTKPGSVFDAAVRGELSLLEEMLKDVDVNAVNSSNEALLHVAAERGQLSIIELLLRGGARLDLRDGEGRTPLHRAALGGHTQAVRALLKAGAPVYSVDNQSNTALHLAVKNNHPRTVRALVEEDARLFKNLQTQAEGSFLHSAAREGDWKLAETLLQSGAPVDALDKRKRTALFHAAHRGCEKTTTVLLKAGAKVDRAVIDTAIELNQGSILHLLLEYGRGALDVHALGSALFSAVKKNQGGVVSALIDSGAEVNLCDKQGYTPLLLSAELGHTEAFRALAAKQAGMDAVLPNLSSALHLAVQSGSGSITQMLLEKGLDPNIAGPKAHTPLHVAAQHNRSTLVGLLVQAGAQVNGATQEGLTPLHIATQQGHAETVTQLLQNQADTGTRDKQGRTALHWAASTQGEGTVVGLLLSAGADPDATDKEKRAPLHLAAMEGRSEAVTTLLGRKARGGAKDMDGSTPLHYAAGNGHAPAAAALLSSLKNKGVDERNAWRKTPLHAACERGHDGVVELLLSSGAKVNTLDNSKDTPLHCAARGGHQGAVKRLVGWGQGGPGGAGERADLQANNNVRKTPLQVAEAGDTQRHQDIATLLKRKMLLIK